MSRRMLGVAGAILALAATPAFAQTALPQTARPQTAPTKVALTPPPPATPGLVDVSAWRAAYVDEHGAVPVGASDKGMEYGVAGSFGLTSAGTVRGWMRWEQFAPATVGDGTVRSFTQLVEVDCQNGRGRMLAMDLYPYNNLQGAARHVDAQTPDWQYARPGTVLEQNIGLMCSAAKAAVATVVAQAAAQGGGDGAAASQGSTLAALAPSSSAR